MDKRNRKGKDHPNYKNGKTTAKGYVLILMPEHPRANSKGYITEHIVVAEKALGKLLPPKAEVHHANGTKTSGTLVICPDRAYHMLLHQRTRALKACGNANWRRCAFCKKYDAPENLSIISNKKAYHKKCNANYEHSRREKNSGHSAIL